MPIKPQAIFLFLFQCISFCSIAKDSTFVTRTAVGLSYTHLKFSQKDFVRDLDGTAALYPNNDTTYRHGDRKGLAPVLKFCVQKKFTKRLGAAAGLSYTFAAANYTCRKTTSRMISPGFVTKWEEKSAQYKCEGRDHTITLSLSPVIFFKKNYLAPSVGINYFIRETMMNGTRTTSEIWTQGPAQTPVSSTTSPITARTKKDFITLSAGLSLGHDVELRKLALFYEFAFDVRSQNQQTFNSVLNVCLTLGVKL